jgi:hypothetical protein
MSCPALGCPVRILVLYWRGYLSSSKLNSEINVVLCHGMLLSTLVGYGSVDKAPVDNQPLTAERNFKTNVKCYCAN